MAKPRFRVVPPIVLHVSNLFDAYGASRTQQKLEHFYAEKGMYLLATTELPRSSDARSYAMTFGCPRG